MNMENQPIQNELQDAINRSVKISETLRELLGEEAELNSRGRLAMAYLSLALDHRDALLLLAQAGAYASAAALQRPLLEALVGGAWIQYAATDDHLRQIGLGRPSLAKFETMVQKLRKTHPLGNWFESFRKHYDILGDYTHGHNRQISRWISPSGIGPCYPPAQMIEMLRFADVVGLMAAVHREQLAGRAIDRLINMMESAIKRETLERVKGIEPSS